MPLYFFGETMFEIVYTNAVKASLDSYVSVKQKWAALVSSIESSSTDEGKVDIFCKRKNGTKFILEGVPADSPYLDKVKEAESESFYIIFYKNGHVSFEPKASFEENSTQIERGF